MLGGGAAGLMCAALMGKRGLRVLVLEKSNKVGKKILMSGGGRCNFTNMEINPENYLCENPHFCKSALNQYTQWDFIGLVCDYGIPYHEKTLGQLFCDNSAKDILNMLLGECDKVGVTIQTRCQVNAVDYAGHYKLDTDQGTFESGAVVVATGGLSIPTLGGSGFGYKLAEQFGLELLPTRAGLVPFTLTGNLKQLSESLSGVAVDTLVSHPLASFRESVLFTHRGLSGPAILQISSYWQPSQTIEIDLLPEQEGGDCWLMEAKRNKPKSRIRTLVSERLPKKLVQELEGLMWAQYSDTPIGEVADQALEHLAHQLSHWQILPSGTEGYRTAEVTLGGVSTAGISSKTMECKNQPGLFFIGEVMDVTGHLGGYNFQWAWSSGYAAAQSVSKL